MKRLFVSLLPVAITAVALVSCQKEIEPAQEPQDNLVKITVKATPQRLANVANTKTYIDTYQGTHNTILWGTGEYMKLAVTAGENTVFANSTDASADLFDGEPQALFEFSVTPGSAASYLYQGIYPASAAVENNNTNPSNYKVTLSATQNATASSYDPAAYIMVAEPKTFTSVETDWSASFRRATALNKITLKNVPSGVSINRVEITAPTEAKMAGRRYINLTTTESDNVLGEVYYGATNSVVVNYATALAGGADIDVWFTSWEVEVTVGQDLIIVAYTTDNKKYTKTITVPAGKSIKFQEGYLNTLGANMSGITPVDLNAAQTLPYTNTLLGSHDGFTINTVTNGGLTDVWKDNSTYGLTANGYQCTDNIEAYAESPLIDLTSVSGAKLTFEHGINYFTDVATAKTQATLEVRVENGSWEAVSIPTYPSSLGNSFVQTEVDLTSYASNTIQFRFKYLATTTNPGRWQIKNVSVTEKVYTTEFTKDADAISVAVGKTKNNNVTVNSGATITYSSDDESIATVAADGTVTGVAEGTTTIHYAVVANAPYPAANGSFGVTVTPSVSYSNFTWDLTTNQTVTATEAQIGWNYRGVTMVSNQAAGKTAANNYYGGDSNNRTSTRFYSGNSLVITPYTGSTIGYVEFNATSESYGNVLKNSTWTNAAATVDATTHVVTVTPIDGTGAFSVASLGGTCGFSSVTIYYTGDLEPLANYTVTLTPTTETDCSYTASVGGSQITSGDEVTAGQKVTLAATAGSDYVFGSWSVKDGSDNNVVVTNNEFTMPSSNVTVSATFIRQYTITCNATTNGSISASAAKAVAGTEITLTATPDPGYGLDSWTVKDSNDNDVTVTNNKFTMPDSDVTVSATFELGGTQDYDATINFGNSGTKINAASVSGNDSQGNTWTVTTVGTTSYTQNTSYSQVGKASAPATSITLTTTLAKSSTIKSLAIRLGGFSGTAGTVTLKVGDNTIGTGSLNATNDVTVSSTTNTEVGTALTITITDIAKGVKVYGIDCTYNN